MRTFLCAAVVGTSVALSASAAADCTSDADCAPGFVCRGDGACLRDPSAPATPPKAPSTAATPPGSAPGAQAENTAEACRSGLDEDRDGHFDCADQDCAAFVFCAQGSYGQAGPPPGTPPGPEENPRGYRTERQGIKALL